MASGYGRIAPGGDCTGVSPLFTHRVALALELGVPYESLDVVAHSCDNPPCCNPEHLFVGTVKDNVIDMMNKGRDRYGWQRRKTHCKSGHPFSAENTRVDETTGWRTCRTCKGWKGLTL